MKLKGRVAIITGGGGVIGRAIALKLAEEGASIVAADIVLESAEETAEKVRASGAEAEAVNLDVRDRENIEEMAAGVLQRFGRVDILVNNAGGSARQNNAFLKDAKPEIIDWVLDVNLRGPIFCIKALIGHMIENRRGKIVNLGSIVGIQGKPRMVDYAAAKGGIIAMTRTLAMEVGIHGITVNCVSPGLVPRDPGQVDENFGDRFTHIGRPGKPEEVAALILFLVSDEADFITGQNYIIDGGRSLGLKGDKSPSVRDAG